MPARKPSPAPGRPKDAKKYAAILRAARAQFFERGFEAVGIEGVAAAAGVARMTVYSHFRDKHALFAAVVENQAAQLSAALAIIAPGSESPGSETLDALRADLTNFGVGLLTFFAKPETKAFNRLIESEARHHAALAEAFAAAGPRAVISRLARRLESAMGFGVIERADPLRAACQLIGLLRSFEMISAAAKKTPHSDGKSLQRHVDDCVARFGRAYAAEATNSG
jgi:TetR/AcrR family transcriptional regulator, mexJK operon transcriptional repressor